MKFLPVFKPPPDSSDNLQKYKQKISIVLGFLVYRLCLIDSFFCALLQNSAEQA